MNRDPRVGVAAIDSADVSVSDVISQRMMNSQNLHETITGNRPGAKEEE